MAKITQLSIFINNEPGSFAAITEVLKDCNINLKAFNIAESSGFGVLRAITDDPEKACEVLKERGIIVKLIEVVAVPIKDSSSEMYRIGKVFGDNSINIEYAYAFSAKKESVVIFRVDNPDAAAKVLGDAGHRTLALTDL